MKIIVNVDMPTCSQLVQNIGLNEKGDAQRFHTDNINRRITRYMPYRTGALSTKLKSVKSPTEIEVRGPYAVYQYYGKVMVGPPPKVATDKPLNQKPHAPGNDRAGPYWDRRLVAAEGDAIVEDLKNCVARRNK